MKRHCSDLEHEATNLAHKSVVAEKKSTYYCINRQIVKSYKSSKVDLAFSVSENSNFLCDRTISFMESGDLCDIVAVELAERSLYFERLLHYHKADGVIPIPEFLKSSFSAIVEFIRTDKTNITKKNVYELFIAADYLLLSGLKIQCSDFLLQYANDPGVAICIWINCRHLYWPELGNMAFEKILENFEGMLHTSEFLDLGINEIVQILSNDSLNSKKEMLVFDAICSWVYASPQQRVLFLDRLLTCVRFGLLTEDEIYYIKGTPMVAKQANCAALASVISGFSTTQPSRSQWTPRIAHDAILVFGGWCERVGPRAAVQVFDPCANKWTLWSAEESQPQPQPQTKTRDNRSLPITPCFVEPKGDYTSPLGEIPKRVYAGCAIINSKIYLIGGYNGSCAVKSTLCYDTTKDSGWFEVSCMYEKRHYVCVTATGDYIYAMGGHNGEQHGRLSTAERYRISDNLWHPICAMLCVRSDAASAEINGKVYICGGFDGRMYHDTVETYDDVADQWCLLNSRMVSPRGGLSLARLGTTLYAIGGNDGNSRLSSIERYDAITDRWQLVGNLAKRKSNLSCAVIDRDIFILGGWSDEHNTGILDTVECFDTKTESCHVVQNLAFFASATCACSFSGKNGVNKYIRRKPQYIPRSTSNNMSSSSSSLTTGNIGVSTVSCQLESCLSTLAPVGQSLLG